MTLFDEKLDVGDVAGMVLMLAIAAAIVLRRT